MKYMIRATMRDVMTRLTKSDVQDTAKMVRLAVILYLMAIEKQVTPAPSPHGQTWGDKNGEKRRTKCQ